MRTILRRPAPIKSTLKREQTKKRREISALARWLTRLFVRSFVCSLHARSFFFPIQQVQSTMTHAIIAISVEH